MVLNQIKSSPVYSFRSLIVLLVLVVLFSGCLQQEDTSEITYMDVSPAEAKELIENNPDLIIIDVSPYYDQGHIPGAVNYPLGDGSLDDAIPTLDKNGKYLVYCHSTSVAVQAAQKMIDAGIENVYRLEGNYQGWVDAGYEVEP